MCVIALAFLFVWAGSANCPQGGVGCLHERPAETVTSGLSDQCLVMRVTLKWTHELPLRSSFSYPTPWLE